ncbi:MAG: T9SS type A sorting domain-containing protein [Elusimicrobia bacterium]|nr:T9SS type A sorting domain-containing protein [Elusimicrobiota bacterium]
MKTRLRRLLLTFLALGTFLRLAATERQWYTTGASSIFRPVDLTLDGEGNPVLLGYGNSGSLLVRWVEDHWEEEMVPGPILYSSGLSVDSLSQPHALIAEPNRGVTHIFKSGGIWYEEPFPFGPVYFNFTDAKALQIVKGIPTVGNLEIERAFKDSSGWHRLPISTVAVNSQSPRLGIVNPDGTFYLLAIDSNRLKIIKLVGQVTDTLLDIPSMESRLLGFAMDTDSRFQILTSSRTISYPPLSTLEHGVAGDGPLYRSFFYRDGKWQRLALESVAAPVFRPVIHTLTGADLNVEPLQVLTILEPLMSFSGFVMGQDETPFLFLFVWRTEEDQQQVITAKLPPPASATVSERTPSSVLWSWPPRTSEIVTGYRLRRVGDNADLSGLLAPTVDGWTQTGLGPNTGVSAYLETIYPGFVLPSTPVVAASAGVVAHSVQLRRDSSGRLSSSWAGESNPAGTLYRVDLVGSDGRIFTVTVANPAHVVPFLTTEVAYGMNVTVLSSDGSGVPMATVESVISDGQRTRVRFGLGSMTVEADLFPERGFARGVFAAAPVTAFPGNAQPELTPTGRGFQLEMDHPLPRDQSATVSVVFSSDGLSGTPGGPWVLARYDKDRAVWVALPTRSESETLTATVDGFGTFQVMGRAVDKTALNDMEVYPNPFRPSEGAPLVVRDVPADARVVVFTFDGRRVRTLPGNETGLAVWDGSDESGAGAKSGVYVISLERNGQTKKMKVIVER